MQITSVESLNFCDGGAVEFEVDKMPDTHEEWAEAIGDLPLSELLGDDLNGRTLEPHPDNVSYTMSRQADGSMVRDWWAGDHLWHVDGTRWNTQPTYTVIGCRQADEGAPATELLDTVALLEIMDEQGFWGKYMPEQSPDRVRSVFADSTYYREALPHMQDEASVADQRLIQKRIEEDLARVPQPVSSLDELAAWHDYEHPPKEFPLIRRTWLDGFEAIFVDGGGRNSTLIGYQGVEYKATLQAIRELYLKGDRPYAYDLVRTLGWSANKCLAFPQIGTLHRALPGNQFNRMLHLGFLVDGSTLDNPGNRTEAPA